MVYIKNKSIKTLGCVFSYIRFHSQIKKCASEVTSHSKVPAVDGILINCKLGVRNQVGTVKAIGFGCSKIIDRQYKYTRRHEIATLLELEQACITVKTKHFHSGYLSKLTQTLTQLLGRKSLIPKSLKINARSLENGARYLIGLIMCET